MIFTEQQRQYLHSIVEEEDPHHNEGLSKQLKKLKKDLGAKTIKQNYRGTGAKKHRRQFWIRFANHSVIDVFLNDNDIQLGGVVWIDPRGNRVKPSPDRIKYEETPERTYEKVKTVLKHWVDGG